MSTQADIAAAQAGVGGVTVKTISRGADGGAVDPKSLIQPRVVAPAAAAAPAAATVPDGSAPEPQQASPQALQNAVKNIILNKRAAAPAAVTPPAEPVVVAAEPPATGETPPADVVKEGPKAVFSWAQLRHQAKEAEKFAEAARAEAETAKAEAMKNAEILAQLKTQNEELNDRMEKTDFLNSPTFKQRYQDKIDATRGELAVALAQVLDTPDQAQAVVDKVLMAPSPKAFVEELAKVPAMFQPMALAARAAISKTLSDRDQAVTNWKASRAQLDAEQAKDQRIRLATEIETETARAVEHAVKNDNFLLRKTGDPAWDKAVDERVAAAKQTLAQPRSRQDIIDLVMEGSTAPALRQALASTQAELIQMRTEMARLGAAPASSIRPAAYASPAPAPAAKAPKRADQPSQMRNTIQDVLSARLGVTR